MIPALRKQALISRLMAVDVIGLNGARVVQNTNLCPGSLGLSQAMYAARAFNVSHGKGILAGMSFFLSGILISFFWNPISSKDILQTSPGLKPRYSIKWIMAYDLSLLE